MTNVPDGESTTPVNQSAAADGAPEEFARLRMKGSRFDGARLPVEAMVELLRFQHLILKAAELAWRNANPDEEPPVDFADGSKLVLSQLEPGSTVSVLALASETVYDPYYEMGREELEREIEVIEEWLAASSEERAKVDLVSLPLLEEPEFADLGSSGDPGDELTLASATTPEPIKVTEELRTEAIAPLAEQRAQLVSPPEALVPLTSDTGDVAGRLFGVNADKQSFEMSSLRFGTVKGWYKNASLTDDLRKVLENTSRAPVVRVSGKLRFRGDELQRLIQVTSVQRLAVDGEAWAARFTELASLDSGWDADDPSSKPIDFAALDAAGAVLTACKDANRPLPGIFPMTDGGVQLEWASPEYVTGIEISPDLDFELFDLEVSNRTVTEEETNDISVAKAFVERTKR